MNCMSKFLTLKYKNMGICDILKQNNILVVNEPLGKINGYYNKVNDQKIIHVNSELTVWYGKFVVAYQLYYALNNIEYKFWLNGTCDFGSDAFKFATSLLCNDHDTTEHDYLLIMA